MRRAAARIIVGLGVLTWLLCLPRLTTLAELLYFTGAFVASTIWPIAAGLFWRRTNSAAAVAGMVLGSAAGLDSYFAIGFYVAALVSAAVSMTVVLLSTWLRRAISTGTLPEEHPLHMGATMTMPLTVFSALVLGAWHHDCAHLCCCLSVIRDWKRNSYGKQTAPETPASRSKSNRWTPRASSARASCSTASLKT